MIYIYLTDYDPNIKWKMLFALQGKLQTDWQLAARVCSGQETGEFYPVKPNKNLNSKVHDLACS